MQNNYKSFSYCFYINPLKICVAETKEFLILECGKQTRKSVFRGEVF
jgi:hypothetical protein